MSDVGVTSSMQTWHARDGREQRKSRRRSESVRSTHVVVARLELIPLAERMARAWRASIDVAPQGELRDRVAAMLGLPGASVVVVGLSADFDDVLLLEMLAEVQRSVAGPVPWESVPRLALLTGRDAAQVAALSERLLRSGTARGASTRFLRLQSSADVAEAVACERGNGAQSVRRVIAGGEALLEVAREPATVIAWQTHGGEACARGGGGVVVCGRSAQPAARPAGTSGVLACGRELACPRGPFPLPLRELRAQTFLMASCSGLRLGDGALTDDFNLGLSFLDGTGQAYVSGISGTRGNDLATSVFLAAVSSGATVGEATTLINAAVMRAGIDVPRFVAVGAPMLVPAADRVRPVPMPVRPSGDVVEIEGGDAHFADLIFDDERVLALADRDALLLTGVEGEPEIVWFSRPEAGPDGGRRLRVFLFRFPDPIGRIRLAIGDRRETSADALRWLSAFAEWLERWRTFGLAASEPDAYTELRGAHDEVAATLSRLLPRLAWSTTGRALLDAHCAVIQSLCRAAGSELTDELAARLRATFWLTNEDSGSAQLYETRAFRCDACGRPGVERRVRNLVTGDARDVRSCCRCGIVFDGRADGHLRALKLRAPLVARRGERIALEIEIDLRPGGEGMAVSVHPCLTTHVVDQVKPEPPRADLLAAAAGTHTLAFEVDVPPSLIPHQHFLKVIAASDQELVFASRLLFVE